MHAWQHHCKVMLLELQHANCQLRERLSHMWRTAGISMDDKPSLKAWLAKIEARPAVQKGIAATADFLKAAGKQ